VGNIHIITLALSYTWIFTFDLIDVWEIILHIHYLKGTIVPVYGCYFWNGKIQLNCCCGRRGWLD
jgi:hypothetical protein